MVGSSIYSLVWDNGVLVDSNFSCGTFTDGSTYKIKIISGGFEAYKDGSLLCTQATSLNLNNQKIFLQSSGTASIFDDVLVTGAPSGHVFPGGPASLNASASNSSVDLTWTAPFSYGGAAITDYVVDIN